MEELEGLDLTILLEEVLEVFLSSLLREVLDVEVAALLGVLVLKGLVLKFLNTFSFLEGGLHINLFAINFLVVHAFNSSLGALGSVFAVSQVLGAVANKCVCALFVLLEEERANTTVSFESLADISLLPVVGKVLDEDVVEDLAEVILRLRLELDTDEVIAAISGGESAGSSLGVLKAHEAVAAGGVVLVNGHLGADHLTVVLEHFLKAVRLDSLGDLAHEHAVGGETHHVGAKKLGVVGQSAAGLALEGEEAELAGNLVELIGVVDLDHRRVEGARWVTAHLGHALQVVAGQVLDNLRQLGRGIAALGQVVEVDNLGLGDFSLHFLFLFIWK